MRCWQAAGFVLRRGGRNAGIACVALDSDQSVVRAERLPSAGKSWSPPFDPRRFLPGASCRTLAFVFNRRYAVSRGMTVGRTFVAYTVRRYRYEIEVMRRSLKHRVPPALPRNLVWGLDLTGKTDAQGKLHMILGLLDHGSRGLLTLAALPDKCSWTLLGYLFLAIRKYGRPRAIRTDNEACFTSRVFRAALALAGNKDITGRLNAKKIPGAGRRKCFADGRTGHLTLKRLWGFAKTRYRGLAKNANRAFVQKRIQTMLAMINLVKWGLPMTGEVRPA
jgi:transposase InsO family protein